MKFKVISQEENMLIFMLEGSKPGYSNALRRLMMDEVQTMAIEDVEIRQNKSALYDEIIAHRLGLIPLKTDLSYNLRSACKCEGEGCAQCTVTLTLKGAAKKEKSMIYSDDLKSADPKIMPVFEKFPLVNLLPNQEIEIEAKAELGRGMDHVKWSPGHIYYTLEPLITIDQDKIEDGKKIEELSRGMLKLKNKKLVAVEEKTLIENVDFLEDISEGIQVSYNHNNYLFHIESWGQLSCRELLLQSLDIFDNKLDELAKLIT